VRVKIVGFTGRQDIAITRIAELRHGKFVEFVESVQPPIPRDKKWVLIVSTMFGCPVGCLMCDAGGQYGGTLSEREILAQIDFMVRSRFPGGRIPVEKFKVQFARMGEPSLNPAVLDVLRDLPGIYDAPGLMPSVSTIAPAGSERFFDDLIEIKNALYRAGRFQLQFSIHTTERDLRDRLVPVRKWSLREISAYGERFHAEGDRKITLNAALVAGMPLDPHILLDYFDVAKFLVKITPVNPTYQALRNKLTSYITPAMEESRYDVVGRLRDAGFEVLVSIGETEENHIGSNCGQFVMRHLREAEPLEHSYTYTVERDHRPH
jgi:23S rRNA (adenine2503-C2)-methyltransferase